MVIRRTCAPINYKIRKIFSYICAKIAIMLEDFRLKVFMTVAAEGSFTKAASVLGVSQPAVSQNVAELEKISGVKLFDRLRGEVVLTPEGKIFMDYAKSMLGACEAAGNMFSRLQASVVRVSASEEIYAFFIAPALEKFIIVHPEITFERVLFEDADLVMALRPSPDTPFETVADSIARMRISVSRPPKMGDFAATHEKSSYFDLLYQPSQAFACTKTCRLLKDYFASLL